MSSFRVLISLIKPRNSVRINQISWNKANTRSISNNVLNSFIGASQHGATNGSSVRILQSKEITVLSKRFKKKGKPAKEQEESDDEDDSDDERKEDDEVVDKGFADKTISPPSLRMDAVIKVATGLGRARIEEAFYDSRIRMNGEKVSKKSENVTEGDEIDIILGRSFNNNELLDIARVIIRNVPDIANNKGRSNIEVRHFKKLIIENYPDPYEGTIINTPKERSN